MTYLEPEDILRQALYAAAESVEPAPDGLARIHSRLSAPRPLLAARLIAGWETLCQFVMLRLEFMLPRLEPVRTALVSWLDMALPTAHRGVHHGAGRLRPLAGRLRPMIDWLIAVMAWLGRMVQPRTGLEGRSSRYGWVRSVAAMATVVLVAVAGGVALSVLPHQIVREAQSVFSSQTNGSGGGSHPTGVNGSGTHLQQPSGSSGDNGTAPSPSASCKPTAKSKHHATATPSPTLKPTPQSATPSPTTPSPTTPPPTTPPPTTPPPSSGPEQGTSSASAQAAQETAVVIIGARSGSGAKASSSPSPCPSGSG